MYYYHIPAVTGVFLNVSDLIEYSKAHSLLPRLAGALLCRLFCCCLRLNHRRRGLAALCARPPSNCNSFLLRSHPLPNRRQVCKHKPR